MSSSKHLWSGDWERDSETPPTEPLGSAPVTPPSPEEPPRDDGGAPRRRLTALGALVALLIVVGVVLAVVLPGSSSNSNQRTSAQLANPAGTGGNPLLQQTTPQQTTPQQPTTPQQAAQPTPQATAPARIGPTYAWLGMQISETPLGITVATVSIGGVADTAGVNPGDVITAVNSTAVGSIAQLRAAVGKLSVGASFQLTVSRGSTPVTISATLANRPKRQS